MAAKPATRSPSLLHVELRRKLHQSTCATPPLRFRGRPATPWGTVSPTLGTETFLHAILRAVTCPRPLVSLSNHLVKTISGRRRAFEPVVRFPLKPEIHFFSPISMGKLDGRAAALISPWLRKPSPAFERSHSLRENEAVNIVAPVVSLPADYNVATVDCGSVRRFE